jgi:TPR repeat protein
MNCTTKDADELGDAYAIILSPDLTYHWRRIGLVFEGGHSLAKLALSNRQMHLFDTGAATSERGVFARELAEGDASAHRSLYALTADPDLATYDPEAAAGHLLALLGQGTADDEGWALARYARAEGELRDLIGRGIDIRNVFERAATRGDMTAKLDYALMLRATATTLGDLQASVRWLKEAAEGGNVTAMSELAQMLAFGMGVPQDRRAALTWAEQAERAGDPEATELARLLRLEKTQ